MNREEVSKHIRESPNNNHLLILSTGFGKTKLAIDLLERVMLDHHSILIVVPRLVLIENWKEELTKFGFSHYIPNITFTTYNSLHKYVGKHYTYVIYDECHHISERCKEILPNIFGANNCFLSATVSVPLKWWITTNYENVMVVEVNLRDAIDNEVLPDPKVILLPLTLDYINPTETLTKEFKGRKHTVTCMYKDRWKYLKNYNCIIRCTPSQYHQEISADIEYWKKRAQGNQVLKNKWLKLCGDRLKWLSNQKNETILLLLKKLKDYRTLTFCNSIEQTELLGKHCINSKNKNAINNLEMFNNKKIKHITSVNMLNEGCNLTDCRIGIFASLNSSDTLVRQKNGRLLRHKEPVIIIPYYKHTREEELVEKMLENYNSELITTIYSIEGITI